MKVGIGEPEFTCEEKQLAESMNRVVDNYGTAEAKRVYRVVIEAWLLADAKSSAMRSQYLAERELDALNVWPRYFRYGLILLIIILCTSYFWGDNKYLSVIGIGSALITLSILWAGEAILRSLANLRRATSIAEVTHKQNLFFRRSDFIRLEIFNNCVGYCYNDQNKHNGCIQDDTINLIQQKFYEEYFLYKSNKGLEGANLSIILNQ